MSEERKKKSGATWKTEELNKSRAFVELTEYIANALENDTHFFILAELHIKLYSLQTKAHTLQSAIVSVLQARLVPQSPTGCF